ncbi:MAG TPA: hypothetical protein VMU54_24720 [Planctomycetota bacterium]|nr:hypothetical protein [Planctomycetota bacterium]
MRHSRRLGIAFGLLAVLAIAGTITFLVPLLTCPSCSGAGRMTAMVSHPDAMGSERSSSRNLMDVRCATCDGKTRVSLYHGLMSGQPALSSR